MVDGARLPEARSSPLTLGVVYRSVVPGLGRADDLSLVLQVAVSMARAVSVRELARISAVSLAFAVARLLAGVSKYVAMAAVTALAVCERAVGL